MKLLLTSSVLLICFVSISTQLPLKKHSKIPVKDTVAEIEGEVDVKKSDAQKIKENPTLTDKNGFLDLTLERRLDADGNPIFGSRKHQPGTLDIIANEKVPCPGKKRCRPQTNKFIEALKKLMDEEKGRLP